MLVRCSRVGCVGGKERVEVGVGLSVGRVLCIKHPHNLARRAPYVSHTRVEHRCTIRMGLPPQSTGPLPRNEAVNGGASAPGVLADYETTTKRHETDTSSHKLVCTTPKPHHAATHAHSISHNTTQVTVTSCAVL